MAGFKKQGRKPSKLKPLLFYLLMFYWPKHLRWPTNRRFQRVEELSFICWWEKWQCHIQRGVHIKWKGFMALKIYHSIYKNTLSQYRILGCNTLFPLAHFLPSTVFWFALLLLSSQLIPIVSFPILFLCVLSFTVIWLGVNFYLSDLGFIEFLLICYLSSFLKNSQPLSAPAPTPSLLLLLELQLS